MAVKVMRDGKSIPYDEINISGIGCLGLVVPWLVGIVYLLWSLIATVATFLGTVVS